MKSKSILLSCALGVAFLAPLAPQQASAQVTKSGPGYLLRMKFVKGQVLKYTIVTKTPMGSQSMVSTMTVKDIKNGIATIYSVVNMPQTGAGRNSKPITQTLQMDNRGKVVGRGSATPAGAATPTLPANAVRVGESWNGDIKVQSGVNLTSVYTLLSVKTVGSKLVAEIGQKVSGNMGTMGKMSGQGRLNLDGRDGSLMGGTVNMNLVIPSQDPKSKPTNMAISTVITRN